LNIEQWAEIPDTDYSVSNFGRVASRKHGGWRVLRPGKNGDGYRLVGLCSNGVQQSKTVHQLVAEAFISMRPSEIHEVNHKDGNRENNKPENLEWVTRSGNQIHRYRVLFHGAPRGERSGKSKLKEPQVREIKRRLALGETQASIAERIGTSKSTVMFINTGRTWAWLA